MIKNTSPERMRKLREREEKKMVSISSCITKRKEYVKLTFEEAKANE